MQANVPFDFTSAAFLSHGRTQVLQDFGLLFPNQATKIPTLFHPCNLEGKKKKKLQGHGLG